MYHEKLTILQKRTLRCVNGIDGRSNLVCRCLATIWQLIIVNLSSSLGLLKKMYKNIREKIIQFVNNLQ